MISIRKLVLAATLVGTVGVAQAAYLEVGDASNFLSAAQTANESIIQGAITAADEGDVYRVVFASGGMLTIAATGSIDTNIGFFDASFNALRGDDDSGPGLDSLMTIAITAGTYYVGIGDYRMSAFDGDGDAWFLSGLPPANLGPVDRIENVGGLSPGSYTLTLSMPVVNATVPEPASIAIMGLALAGLGCVRRRSA